MCRALVTAGQLGIPQDCIASAQLMAASMLSAAILCSVHYSRSVPCSRRHPSSPCFRSNLQSTLLACTSISHFAGRVFLTHAKGRRSSSSPTTHLPRALQLASQAATGDAPAAASASDPAGPLPAPEREGCDDVGISDSPSRASTSTDIHTTSLGPGSQADAAGGEGEAGAPGDAGAGEADEAASTQCENEPMPLDLQCWPDLVELTRCINVKRNAALYAGVLQVRQHGQGQGGRATPLV